MESLCWKRREVDAKSGRDTHALLQRTRTNWGYERNQRSNKTIEIIVMKNEITKPVCDTMLAKTGLSLFRINAGKTLLLALAATLSALPGPGSSATAASFTFTTGNPDGKIATLSQPASTGKIQTETADDFLLTQTSVINQATFTGLIPAGASLSTITDVEVEFYHVFPGDSNTNRTITVPTRANSPGDVEIDGATRDGLTGTLSFNSQVVSAIFSVSNSVVNGINPATNQTTRGEGPVSGQEVLITVTFNPPVALPAGHYFFRPEVLLNSGDFFWLSAPRPIVAPGTPFLGDLQSWIRNDNLAPDWLRIGSDITLQGPFNAAFSLSGETDQDGDGVGDSLDQCPDTTEGSVVDAEGCSIDQLAPCVGPVTGGIWKNHGQYVSTVAQVSDLFVQQGLITEAEQEAIVLSAAQSDCGRKVSELQNIKRHGRRH